MRAFFLVLLLAWLMGVALGVAGLPLVVALLAAAVAGLVVVKSRLTAQVVVGAVLLVCLGYVWGGYPSLLLTRDGCTFAAPVEVTVVGQPQVQARNILVTAEDGRGCRLLAMVGRFNELKEGDVIELAGRQIQSLDDVREFSVGYASYLERRGIGATWRYPDIRVVQRGDSWMHPWHIRIRERVTSLFVEPDASVVLAVLFAERGTLPEQIVDSFRATGVSHVLAISGLHISLIAGMLLAVLMLLPLPAYLRNGVVITWLWSYVVFIGWPTSAVRAASFWTIALVAWQLNMLVSLPTVLLLAAAVLVSFDPLLLADVSFQLSMSAVLGIFLVLFLSRDLWRRRWLSGLVLVSLGASLTTAPLIAYHFGNVALSSVVTNLLVVPFVPALLALAIVALMLSLVFMPAALLLSYCLHGIVAWVSLAAGVISAVPGLFLEEVAVPAWLPLVYYLAVAVVSVAFLRWRGRSWREVWE